MITLEAATRLGQLSDGARDDLYADWLADHEDAMTFDEWLTDGRGKLHLICYWGMQLAGVQVERLQAAIAIGDWRMAARAIGRGSRASA